MRQGLVIAVLALFPGCLELDGETTPSPSPTPPELVCETGSPPTLHGRVQDPTGTALHRVWASWHRGEGLFRMVDTDAWGRFAFCERAHTDWQVKFNKTGFHDTSIRGDKTNGHLWWDVTMTPRKA